MGKRPTTPGGTTRGSGPAKPELVGNLLDRSRTASARRAGVALDRETWRDVVGERIARRTAAGRVHGGILTVIVESPVWAQELSLLSEDIVARLCARGLRVTGIRFRTGSVDQLTVPARAAAARPAAELPDDVREHLARIEDPELREVIARAVGHSLANRQRPTLKPKRPAPAPRSAAPETAPSDSGAPRRSAKPRRTREER